MQSSTTINRKHTVNANYFKNINTREQAYWLGFIWADGGISKITTRASGPNRLRISQKWEEKHQLDAFQKTIQSDYEITPVTHKNGHVVGQLDINCRPLCEDLQHLGYDIKSKRIHIPTLQDDLIHHFVRGYFDGDGGLSLYTQQIKRWTVYKQEWSITGNKHFMQEMKILLTKYANVTATVEMKYYKKSPDTASVRYGKKKMISKNYTITCILMQLFISNQNTKNSKIFSPDMRHNGLQPDALRIPCLKPKSTQRVGRVRGIHYVSVNN